MIRASTIRHMVFLALVGCAPVDPSDRGQASREQAVVHEGLRYKAESYLLEREPASVATVAAVTNTTDASREVTFPDGCTVLIRAYREPERARPPAWDQEKVAVCTLALQMLELAPGDSVRYSMEADVPHMLGDSLPTGRYYIVALLRPNGGRVEVPAGVVDVGG